MSQENFITKLDHVLTEVREMILDKNRKYGNSALEPKRVFSKASAKEQINVRMDDKLSRIANAQADDTEDARLDLLGYLILDRISDLNELEGREYVKEVSDLTQTKLPNHFIKLSPKSYDDFAQMANKISEIEPSPELISAAKNLKKLAREMRGK